MIFTSQKLDFLSHGQETILVFDCEFWHIFDKQSDVHYLPEKEYFFVPRELGGFMFTKTGSGWKLNNEFFVTLSSPSDDVSLPISQFATVGIETAGYLDQIKDEIGMHWVDAHRSALDTDKQKLIKKAIKLYESDPFIKKHHEPHSWIKKFMKIYAESVIIVKGSGDIEALKDLCHLKGYEYKNPKHIVDIANWNQKSKKLCGSAQLERTFNCIKRYLDKEISEILDHLPLGDAHNPVMDATMTLVVAMYSTPSSRNKT
jgi:hypothetical protein